MTTAEEMMDDPVFIEHDAPIEDVVELVKGEENTVMVREDGGFIGEIHEHSLLKVLVAEDRLDEEKVIGILGLSFDPSYVAETAEDLVDRHQVKAERDETAEELAFMMDREGLRSIPVVDDEGEIIGVVHENRLIEEI